MMLKLKLQYFGHHMQRADSLEKTLMLGGDWGQEEKGMTEDEMAGWHHRLNGHESEWTPGDGHEQGGLACWRFMGSQRVGHDWATELNWRVSWRTRKASGVIQSESGGLRIMWSLLQALLSSKSQETGALTSKGRRKWIISAQRDKFIFLFYSDPQWVGWCPPALVKAVYWFRCKSLSETSLQIYPEIMLYQPSGL